MTDSPYPADGPRKPPVLSPCNGCGLCCVATACAVALDFVPDAKMGHPCPALEWEDGRSWCGMVRNPAKHSPELNARILATLGSDYDPARFVVLNTSLGGMIRHDLGGESGCDSGDPEDPLGDPEIGMTAAEYHEMTDRMHVSVDAVRELLRGLFR